MNPVVRGVKTVGAVVGRGLKEFTGWFMPRAAGRSFWLPGSRKNYLQTVGDGTGSSTVTAPLFWVARTFPEAPPMLWKVLENGQEERERNHRLLQLLERPNEFYSGVILWMATVLDYYVDGNAYWLKLRNRTGTVVKLWWVPHWMMEPKQEDGSSTFITHYEYRVDGRVLRYSPKDVVHFRFGLDGDNPRLGRSPLKSVLREVFTDDEAAAFTASLLSNMGIPGLVVSPEKGTVLNEGDALEMKQYVNEKFGGDKRGEALVMTGPTQISQFGFSPEQLTLRELRRIPEERVTAVMGIPAIVAGLGAGLDRSTFTNMSEAREAAYEAGIIPTQRIMAETVRFDLLTEFVGDGPEIFAWRFGFDLSKVRVLQEDLYRQAQRNDLLYRGGLMTRAEGRRGMGLDVDEAHDNVFVLPSNTSLISTDGELLNPARVVANTNSNGSGSADEAQRAVEALAT